MLKHRTGTSDSVPIDFSKLRVGSRDIENPITLINFSNYRKVNSHYGDKCYVLRAIFDRNYDELREISRYFYDANGIYQGLCRYAAYLYRYDWYITPYSQDISKENEKKLLKDFSDALLFLDKSELKRVCGNIALNVMKDGVYYGILMDFNDRLGIQQLPVKYCRCRYYSSTIPIVELNLAFFDACYWNTQQRIRILKTFPREIQRAYIAYKEGKLKGDYPGDRSCWFPLETGTAFKISFNDSEIPPFINVIPSLIDLDQAQELDRKKMMQQLLKIIVQKLPLDKNGDLIFDVDEAKDIHDNAVAMLKRAIGIDVLTTFADIEKIDTKDTNSSLTKDDLERAERTVYNNANISRNLFNAEGNLATTNSILVDESSMRELPLLFEALFNRVLEKFNRKNHYEFRINILQTTQFNYQALAKLYKEQAQMGFNLILPQIALGQSQSNILASITFQNEVLELAQMMQPPLTSNVQTATNLDANKKKLGTSNQSSQSQVQIQQKETTTTTGRPAKEDSEKSEKTIANIESQG